jgi:cysteine desulfurase
MGSLYLDHAATTPVADEVLEAMLPFFQRDFGNPSSLHGFGRAARAEVERCREALSSFIGAAPGELVFTGGGTESNNLALKGVSRANREKGNHVITTAVEHPSVLESCRSLEREGFRVTYLPVDGRGLVDPGDVKKALTGGTVLVSVMHGNNEIGTLEPVGEIGALVRERGISFHTDAVQTFGHLPLRVDGLGVDLLSFSAHKFYGPKGIGGLYVRRGTRIEAHVHGGGQERGLRSSTHNVPGIAGMAKAADLAGGAMEAETEKLAMLRERLVAGVLTRIDGVRVNGHGEKGLPGIVHLSFEGLDGEALLLRLDLLGVACSIGSACSSAAVEPSHVLRAVGLSREAILGSVRFSLGRGTTTEDVDRLLEILPGIVGRLRNVRRDLK